MSSLWLQKSLSVLSVLLVVASGCGQKAVVPSSYEPYNCKDGNFKIEYPAGWKAESFGKGSYASAKFTSGNAVIAVDTSLASGLMGGLANGGMVKMVDPNAPAEIPPVVAVHQMEKETFETDEGAKESEPVMVQTGLGDAQKAEFKGAGAFGGETRGYRVTALSRDYRIRVICKCPAAEWDAMRPAFDKVVLTLGAGRVE